MTIEAVSVISSGLIAVSAIAATTLQSKRRLDHEREMADLENVRSILDDAAILLHETSYVLDEVRSGVTQHTPSFVKSESGTKTYKDLGERGKAVDALVERLRIRFGREHTVVTSFESCCEAMLDIWRALGMVRLEEAFGDSPAGRHMAAEFDAKMRDRLDAARERFDVSRARFIDAANRVAEARLRSL